MRNLILIRHAQASFEAPAGDRERPLAASGQEEARNQGDWLARNRFAPDRVLCSPALRTRQTAEAMGLAVTHELDAIYDASAGELLRLVEAHSDADVVTLIGHNPGISGVAGFLTAQQIILQPGTIVGIRWTNPIHGPPPMGTGQVRLFRHAAQMD